MSIKIEKKRHKLFPIKIIENDSDRVVDLLLYKNHYALSKELNIFQEIITESLYVDDVQIHIQVKKC